ncbi:hypothetical protein Dimus_033180 [Dionaea muscipula]
MRPKSSRESKRSVSNPRATGSSSSNDASSSTSASGLEEGRPSSRLSTRSSHSASLSEHSYLTPEDLINELDGLKISSSSSSLSDPNNPRSFPHSVKQQCWDKADTIKGRDPNRWRRDPLGNIVFRKLVGCPGCLCHDYDHIVPYSKGGKSILENCQVLQATVNRSKGNRTDISRADLIQRSSYCRVSGRDMDLIELSAYGNVHQAPGSGGCNIQ